MHDHPICTACGTQYRPGTVGERCPICVDERQYVPAGGQRWTTLAGLAAGHRVVPKQLHPRLYELQMAPAFAIGQRALLVTTPQGNILWDCFALLDAPTIDFIQSRGGLRAMAFSHPHYYTTMNEWAAVFECPVLVHAHDEPWIFNRGPRVQLWAGTEHSLWEGLQLLHVGGHFPGSSLLRVPFLSPAGALLCGDTFYVSPSQQHLALMYSYPNRIPLPLAEIQRIKRVLQPVPFDSVYGFYDFQNLCGNARAIWEKSLNTYV